MSIPVTKAIPGHGDMVCLCGRELDIDWSFTDNNEPSPGEYEIKCPTCKAKMRIFVDVKVIVTIRGEA